jgi:outer membrane lipoprotein SlyB
MKAVSLTLAALASATLVGCAGNDTKSTSGLDKRPDITAREMPYEAGTGVVQSWTAVPSPAAGASGRVDPTGSGLLRLGIRMDDGSVQYVDTESRDFPIGTRVELTPGKEIRRPGAPG